MEEGFGLFLFQHANVREIATLLHQTRRHVVELILILSIVETELLHFGEFLVNDIC